MKTKYAIIYSFFYIYIFCFDLLEAHIVIKNKTKLYQNKDR